MPIPISMLGMRTSLIEEYKEVVDNFIGSETDDDAMVIPLEQCIDLWRPWRKALIIKILGPPITYNFLCQRLHELWKHQGRLEITDLDQGYYVVRFTKKEDYDVALEDGPWIIMGHYLAVKRWKPFFQPEHEPFTTTMAWVRFNSLSLEIFRTPLLEELGNKVGKTVRVDPTTAMNIRGRFARVCVEVDLNKRLKSSVVINGRRYKVVYEGLHQICFSCGKFGHCKDECPDTPDKEGKDSNSTSVDKQKQKPQGPTPEEPFGPWMIAERRRKWNSNKYKSALNSGNNTTDHNKNDHRKEQEPAKSGKVWVAKGKTNAEQASGSRFGVLIDESESQDIETEEIVPGSTEEMVIENLTKKADIPDTVLHLRNEVQQIQSHGGQAAAREIHKDALSDDTPEVVKNLRKAVHGIESHGGQVFTREIHKTSANKPNTGKKDSGNIDSSKQCTKQPKSSEKRTQGTSEFGRRIDLGLQGHQMKRTAPSRNKNTSRVSLTDLSNISSKASTPGMQGQIKVLNRATPSLPQNLGEHTKKHPPDMERPPGLEHLSTVQNITDSSSALNPPYEVEVRSTYLEQPQPQ